MLVDKKILQLFQSATEYLQIRTGKNCYWWAYWATHLSAVLVLIILAKDISGETVDWFGNGLLLVILLFEYFNLQRFRRWAETDRPQVDAASGETSRSIFRLIFLVISIFAFWSGDFLHASLWWMWATIEYLVSCRPLPPGTRKVWRAGKTVDA